MPAQNVKVKAWQCLATVALLHDSCATSIFVNAASSSQRSALHSTALSWTTQFLHEPCGIPRGNTALSVLLQCGIRDATP